MVLKGLTPFNLVPQSNFAHAPFRYHLLVAGAYCALASYKWDGDKDVADISNVHHYLGAMDGDNGRQIDRTKKPYEILFFFAGAFTWCLDSI